MIQKLILLTLLILTANYTNAQIDSILSRMSFDLDYRFRAEQDWDSKKSDGTFRDTRSRLRYRLRTGASYKTNNYSLGFRIRTGDQNKQQDPQLTIGKGLEEFGTLPIGFEKIYFQYESNNYTFWLGKNTFPFEKNNELFWSDNVFPEGVLFNKTFEIKSSFIDKIKLSTGHFILGSNNRSFSKDAFIQGIQSTFSLFDSKLLVFPSFYSFRNIPNIPDGEHTFILDYNIIHLGTKIKLLENKKLNIDFDYYNNIEEYSTNQNIISDFKDQTNGLTMGISYGKLKEKKDWFLKLTYANLQQYSILDYMAQNDWARWDYSSFNSPDGRLSNYQGIELVFAYAISDKINLVSKYYVVDQLIAYGISKETGQRIRFDIDIKI